ncbi:MAG: carboxypeptidase regulatory-like domain-containing protein [Pyrinomonadaceae bacterium]
MRFLVRFTLALGLALALGLVCPLAQQAQVKQGASKLGRLQPAVQTTSTRYEVMQTTGTLVPGTTQVTGFANLDDGTAPITLGEAGHPFSYILYDQTFTTANVSTNGNIQFVSNNADYGQGDVCMPLAQFNYAILPHWGDLSIAGANEGVFTSITDPDGDPNTANRIFNIEWRTSFIGNAPGSLDFEVRLYEDQSRFDIIYATAPGGGSEVTVGVQRGQGATFTEFECHTPGRLFNGLALTFTGTTDPTLFIAGRVTDSDHNPVSGVTVDLTGSATATTMTNGNGEYIFSGLTSGGTYTVTASQMGFQFVPASRTFGGTGNRTFNGNFIVNFIRTVTVNAGDVLINEFRPRGPGAASAVNDFVELLNNTDHGITVNVTDGSSGWLLQASTGAPGPINFIIPNGTTIPAHGHYLGANSSGYNLQPYGTPDVFYDGDLPDGAGVALFSTTNAAALDAAHRLDAVGFSTEANTVYREGAGLPSPGANPGNFSFVRKLTTGPARDTNDNAQDFVFVSTTGGSFGGVQSILGAPGPENSASPIQRNATIKGRVLDPQAATTASPNRVRDFTPVANGPQGTLNFRRRFTNVTGVPITRLRFRVVDITTLNTPNPGGAQADLRVINSADIVVATSGGNVTVRGLTLEQAPDGLGGFALAQPSGGGLNSSLNAGTITVATPLANGASINVEFKLGVQQAGSFRFFVNIEALP